MRRTDRSYWLTPLGAASTRGFSLIDVLVTISVMGVLIAILAPSLRGVRERARQVQCASNLRQIGLGLNMYADNHRGLLPPSVFANDPTSERSSQTGAGNPREMMVLHLGDDVPNNWDGLGVLVADEYLTHLVFYCPSHTGYHPIDRYEDSWLNLGAELIGNYNYRVEGLAHGGALGDQVVSADQASLALVTDGLRTRPDYNHRIGNNLLRLDLSVEWYEDVGGFVSGLLPTDDRGRHRAPGIAAAWQAFDAGRPPADDHTGNGNDIEMMEAPSGVTGFTLRER